MGANIRRRPYAVRSARLPPLQQKASGCSENGFVDAPTFGHIGPVRSYQTLVAWKRAHQTLLLALRATDEAYHARAKSLFEQFRRATVSIEANIVEGYALNTPGLCRRHLRIAIGSAAEAECLLRAAGELGYLSAGTVKALEVALDGALGALHGLLRSPPVTVK
jgi:four helix bundle protein